MLSNFCRAPEFSLVVWGLLLNGIWEFAHSSLFTDHSQGWYYVLWSRLHCTVGDIMILLACFWLTSVLFQTRGWPIRSKFVVPWVAFVTFGLGYTVFSEWMNTQVRGSWTYANDMPSLLGIGLTPILQWLVVPPTILWIIRKQDFLNADAG